MLQIDFKGGVNADGVPLVLISLQLPVDLTQAANLIGHFRTAISQAAVAVGGDNVAQTTEAPTAPSSSDNLPDPSFSAE